MALPSEVLPTLYKVNKEAEGQYSLFIYYLNRDLIKNDAPTSLFGIVIPCGTYPTEQLAKAAQTELAAKTEAQCVVYCQGNHAFPLNVGATKDTIVYRHDVKASVDQIKKSIEEERKRKDQVKARVEEEVNEREDPDSMSYFINKVYRLISVRARIDQQKKMLEEAEIALSSNYDMVVDYVKRFPLSLDEWRADAKSRFAERGELELYAMLDAGMADIEPKLRQITLNGNDQDIKTSMDQNWESVGSDGPEIRESKKEIDWADVSDDVCTVDGCCPVDCSDNVSIVVFSVLELLERELPETVKAGLMSRLRKDLSTVGVNPDART